MRKKIIALLLILSFVLVGCGKKENTQTEHPKDNEPVKEIKKLKIFDENSNSRPYAVIINNYPSAMKVQTGLNDAYMIYEFPIEGGYSRSLALFKDKSLEKIGTVRSARQNYIDYALENDAIFVHWGGNHPAYDVIKETKVNNVDQMSNSKAFFRDNPEKLPTEHTGYVNLSKAIEVAKSKDYSQTTDVKSPLKYSYDEIDLSTSEDAITANTIELKYGNSYKLKYEYDGETKRYKRIYNDKNHVDYFNKEEFTTKNIIIVKVKLGTVAEYKDAAGTNYTNIENIGNGTGYYITNGYAREITWTKESRDAQTVYKYNDGTEINVNDGNTYINLFNKSKDININ